MRKALSRQKEARAEGQKEGIGSTGTCGELAHEEQGDVQSDLRVRRDEVGNLAVEIARSYDLEGFVKDFRSCFSNFNVPMTYWRSY